MNKTPAIDEIKITNGLFLEASAGTGKTYTIAALITRELAMDDTLRIGDFLISTFTRNAAGELKDRVRRRIIEMADIVSVGVAAKDDALSQYLCSQDAEKRQLIVSNLRRAAVEFDTATIGTIHSVCSRILTLAGLPSGNGNEASSTKVLIQQEVNDYVAAQAIKLARTPPEARTTTPWDAALLTRIVEEKASSPDAELWVDPFHPDVAQLNQLAADIQAMVESIHKRTQTNPTFDDLLRRAAMVMADPQYAVSVSSIRQKYRMAFVDEAQDTDPLQWSIFRGIIQAISQESFLVVVGDPKQSIYRFRGADVNAYLEERDLKNLISLDTNYRSDEDMITALNALMANQNFGTHIDYVQVKSAEKNSGSKLTGFQPVEIVDLGDKPLANVPQKVAALRVAELLKNAQIDGKNIALSDVCVLVRANEIGVSLERDLRSMKIPAVSGGTASVIQSEAAQSLQQLLKALDRPSDMGLVRSAISSMFFGRSLLDPSVVTHGVVTVGMSDENSELPKDSISGIDVEHEFIRTLARVIRKEGIAAVEALILSNPLCLNSMLRSERAERRLTDLRHIVELLHHETEGKGIEPMTALKAIADLEALDATAELVSRRIESDVDAVKILTVHAAKGLEFPVVIVADLWKDKAVVDTKEKTADERTTKKPPVFLSSQTNAVGKRYRCIDVAWVKTGVPTPMARLASEAEALDEMKRQFYVAVTRAKHHLSILLPSNIDNCVAYSCINIDAVGKEDSLIPVVPVPAKVAPVIPSRVVPVAIQNFDGSTTQTYRRTSFSGISDLAGGRAQSVLHVAPGSGLDEQPDSLVGNDPSAASGVATGVNMPLARVPKGTYIGTVIHDIFEHFDSSALSIVDEMSRLVAEYASGPSLVQHQKDLIDGLVLAALTPLGPFMGGASLATISPRDRLPELSFEMGLAHLSKGIRVNQIGDVLLDMLHENDPLYGYARMLSSEQFNIPLAGLINGSIDAVLRVKNDDGVEQLFITDYKSNRLDTEDDDQLIDAYHPSRLVHAMEHHHYPLQAILYGVAIYRFLRWKAPSVNSDIAIGGVAYFFLRGMVNNPTFVDNSGCPYGVFQWTAPAGLWARLSDVMAGVGRA
ncbi:MAG: UvrD-helicase domain-containing protein [Ilumatobacteraceae bacterium]